MVHSALPFHTKNSREDNFEKLEGTVSSQIIEDQRAIRIIVHCAKRLQELPNVSFSSKASPYVLVRSFPNKHIVKTFPPLRDGGISPSWDGKGNNEFTLDLIEGASSFLVEIWNESIPVHDLVGKATIDLSSHAHTFPSRQFYALAPAGQIELTLSRQSTGETAAAEAATIPVRSQPTSSHHAAVPLVVQETHATVGAEEGEEGQRPGRGAGEGFATGGGGLPNGCKHSGPQCTCIYHWFDFGRLDSKSPNPNRNVLDRVVSKKRRAWEAEKEHAMAEARAARVRAQAEAQAAVEAHSREERRRKTSRRASAGAYARRASHNPDTVAVQNFHKWQKFKEGDGSKVGDLEGGGGGSGGGSGGMCRPTVKRMRVPPAMHNMVWVQREGMPDGFTCAIVPRKTAASSSGDQVLMLDS
jgi:hypothetical protein